ncbi:MAG: methyltransferase domain-containing protein [Bacteroidetes bacterium]|nr:methyltransferase domain-containing protein [Bacteroidota bacterium]
MSTTTNTKWNPSLYDNKHDFVFKFGEDLVHLLDPKPGERILDLGCGTGYLTNLIASTCAEVIGMDNSQEMIAKAKAEYPNLDFQFLSATDFQFSEPFDAIFSNAVLHWVLEKEKAIACIYKNLKPGGRFVMEMGGKDNVKRIVDAIKRVLAKHGFTKEAAMDIWYFPSVGEYTSLLEAQGFRVTYAIHYDRDTVLKDNASGIKDWIKMFGSSFFKKANEQQTNEMLNEIQESLAKTNHKDGQWFADYKRLRVIAIK